MNGVNVLLSGIKRLVATAVTVAAVGTGCSGDNGSDVARSTTSTTTPTTVTTTRRPPTCEAFKAGDRITVEGLYDRLDLHGEPCVREFVCADGRIHVEASGPEGFAPIDPKGGGKGLEGFLPVDQSGKPRADTRDAVWQVRGPEYDGTGRTKLQFDCGG